MRKKFLASVLAICMTAGMLAGCGSSSATSSTSSSAAKSAATSAAKSSSTSTSASSSDFTATLKGKGTGLKIGLSMADLSSTYIVSASQYFKRLMEAAGAEVTIVNSDGDSSKQADQISDFVNMGCNMICIHANDAAALAPAVEAATAAGVPCVGFNKTVDGGKLNFAVYSSDNTATGASAAQWLADKAKEKGISNPKIAVIQGTMTASDAYLRQDGIEQVAKDAGLTLINEPCEWTGDKAEKALNDVLTANPDLFGIITHSDCMDTGVMSALKQNGLAVGADDSKHIYWASIDCDPTGIEGLNDGLIDVSIEQSPLALATIEAKGCLEVVAKGKTLNGQIIEMDTSVITKDKTSDPVRWALYDPEKAADLWSGTEGIWNKYITQ